MLEVTAAIRIVESELEERFVRASGPGGQNVNKVATAVQLRFDPSRSASLTEEIRARLRVLAGSRMTADGVIVIDARRFRTQAQNRTDARKRLAALIGQAAARPRRRKKTRPTTASRERRLEVKERHSRIKKGRGKVSEE